jgi:PAS domain S-box-containing protein
LGNAIIFRGLGKYGLELAVIGATFLVFAKIGSALASINPSAMPIWPPAGLALAAVVLLGVRVWPAIFAAALIASVTDEIGNIAIASAMPATFGIAASTTLAAVIGGYLVERWSGGRETFNTPSGVAKLALLSIATTTVVSAFFGVGIFYLAGEVEWATFITAWGTGALREIASALVIAPVIILWAISDSRSLKWDAIRPAGIAYVGAILVGLIAFSPVVEGTENWSTLSVLAALPLLWAALRCEQRDTATTALILSGFAVWGAMTGLDPFAVTDGNLRILPLVIFMSSTSVLGLIVSAEVTARRRSEAELHVREQNLHAMFRQAAVGMAQADTTGRLGAVNDRFCEVMQRSAAQLLQMQVQDLIVPDEQAHQSALLAHAISSGDGFATESRVVLPDRSLRWVRSYVSAVDQVGAVPRIMVVADDITTRRQAEESLLSAYAEMQKSVDETRGVLRMTKEALRSPAVFPQARSLRPGCGRQRPGVASGRGEGRKRAAPAREL